MSIFKKFLKYWITLSSVAGFLLGWVFVSQSSEETFASAATVNTGSTQPEAIVLPPVTTLDSLVGNNPQQVTEVQPFTIVQSSQFQPQIRTGGS